MGRDAITGLVVLATSLFLFWATLGLERHPLVPVGPEFYPRLVLGVTALLALLLVVSSVITHRRTELAAAPVVSTAQANYSLVAIAFAIFAIYAIALPYLGFRLATFAFLMAMPLALEPPRNARRWIVVFVVALVATFVIYLAFESYLQVLLPRGRLTGF
ncbi:MAG: tripartite tricarboxylate transporter TctB family protein [Pseudomonadota bacterium]|nr:tripartite tricarboxylate transporter TctB family protein [Burkholderiaceae bacterium]MDQ3447364.1 tripartite tricarboxylate transporter TctB family protein [Pseudomonadota bacterium]